MEVKGLILSKFIITRTVFFRFDGICIIEVFLKILRNNCFLDALLILLTLFIGFIYFTMPKQAIGYLNLIWNYF